MGGGGTFGKNGLLPGVGVKFFRTGKMSANFLLLNSLMPLKDNSHDFFSVPMSNHIPTNFSGIAVTVFVKRLCMSGHCGMKVGLSNVCSHDQNGIEANKNIFPFKVTFNPTGEVKFSKEQPESQKAFMAQFTGIPSGTRLYSIKAFLSPGDDTGIDLGDVITSDKCVTSNYGDNKLAFKHQAIEDDIKLKPEWKDSYNKDCYCNPP